MTTHVDTPFRSPWWWAALLAGGSYCLPAWMGWQGAAVVAWKGSGVGLLAGWLFVIARRTPEATNRQIPCRLAMVLALGALGDVLLAVFGLVVGAVAFAAGHLLAISTYLRAGVRREAHVDWRGLATWALPSVAVTWGLLHGQPLAPAAMAYALLVGAMAGAAWQSAFPRQLTGLGAIAFLVSDWLIFAGQGLPAAGELARWGVWPLYFGGQALIAAGIARGPLRDAGAASPVTSPASPR
jgi:YhhN family